MLPTDLLLGRVTPGHERYQWLLDHGADAETLRRFTVAPSAIDILGVNYYPDLSPRTLVQENDGVSQVATNRWSAGLAESLRAFAARYDVPLLITETSIEGDDGTRIDWLESSVGALRRLRDEGVDIRGYTWWPLFDFVDWSYASGGRNVEEFAVAQEVVSARTSISEHDRPAAKTPFLRRMGLIRLEEREDGSLERVATGAAERFTLLATKEIIDESV
jgi:hypothetical protein